MSMALTAIVILNVAYNTPLGQCNTRRRTQARLRHLPTTASQLAHANLREPRTALIGLLSHF